MLRELLLGEVGRERDFKFVKEAVEWEEVVSNIVFRLRKLVSLFDYELQKYYRTRSIAIQIGSA